MSQTQQQIGEFVAGIQAYVSPVNVINPWRDYVTGYDICPEAVKIRSEHLVRYLEPRMSKARYIFIAEAVGYQGARFSGVPLTSDDESDADFGRVGGWFAICQTAYTTES